MIASGAASQSAVETRKSWSRPPWPGSETKESETQRRVERCGADRIRSRRIENTMLTRFLLPSLPQSCSRPRHGDSLHPNVCYISAYMASTSSIVASAMMVA